MHVDKTCTVVNSDETTVIVDEAHCEFVNYKNVEVPNCGRTKTCAGENVHEVDASIVTKLDIWETPHDTANTKEIKTKFLGGIYAELEDLRSRPLESPMEIPGKVYTELEDLGSSGLKTLN